MCVEMFVFRSTGTGPAGGGCKRCDRTRLRASERPRAANGFCKMKMTFCDLFVFIRPYMQNIAETGDCELYVLTSLGNGLSRFQMITFNTFLVPEPIASGASVGIHICSPNGQQRVFPRAALDECFIFGLSSSKLRTPVLLVSSRIAK
ncbi:hypothetical protein AVEN_77164-1 [Araneus ventricosus]|uniref:Uncharacterized protein n=1 Tax=Araneus ventricosus TaxID=182803 RepID=A0A4Y2IEU0_ARAVE|nr:hypothetical protein AVEN_77164-1 [Araneus ventricosus]